MSSEPESMDSGNQVLLAAWLVMFPRHGPRSQASFDAERVFERHFRELTVLRSAQKGLRADYDQLFEENSLLREQINRLQQEIERLKAELKKATSKNDAE